MMLDDEAAEDNDNIIDLEYFFAWIFTLVWCLKEVLLTFGCSFKDFQYISRLSFPPTS